MSTILPRAQFTKTRLRPHTCERGRIDEVMRFRCMRAHDEDEERAAQKRVEFDLANAETAHIAFRHVRIIGGDGNAESRKLVRHICGDTTETDEACGGPAQSQHRSSGRAPVPVARARSPRVLCNPPINVKSPRNGMIGHFVEAIIRDIRNHHAMLIGGLHVDDINANPIATDRLAPFELGDRLARNTRVLLQNRVRIGGLLGKSLAGAALQADDVSPNRIEYTALDLQIGIVVVADVDFGI